MRRQWILVGSDNLTLTSVVNNDHGNSRVAHEHSVEVCGQARKLSLEVPHSMCLSITRGEREPRAELLFVGT